MKNYLVLFREPDGRLKAEHSESEIATHHEKWAEWFEKYGKAEKLAGGSGLSVEGKMVKGANREVVSEIHKNGTEIVGGFILLKTADESEAVEIIRSCPIFEFGGYAEIREMNF